MTLHGRPDLGTFVPGALYVHDETDEVVRFIGVAAGDFGEDVGVFQIVPEGGCLLATQAGYDRGEAFVTIEQRRRAEAEIPGWS